MSLLFADPPQPECCRYTPYGIEKYHEHRGKGAYIEPHNTFHGFEWEDNKKLNKGRA